MRVCPFPPPFSALQPLPPPFSFCTYCLKRRWQNFNLNEAICLFPWTCPPEQKFSPSLWQSKGSGTSCRGSWSRPDSRQGYCEEEQKDTVKKARNILLPLLIPHTLCQNLDLLNDHIQASSLSQEESRIPPGLPGKLVPRGHSAHRCGGCNSSDDSEHVHILWDNMNTVGYSYNHHTPYSHNTAENGRCLGVAPDTWLHWQTPVRRFWSNGVSRDEQWRMSKH